MADAAEKVGPRPRTRGAQHEYVTKVCPHCDVVAENPEEITEVFGWRIQGTMPQSWCKRCKSKAANEGRRRRRLAEKALKTKGVTDDDEGDGAPRTDEGPE